MAHSWGAYLRERPMLESYRTWGVAARRREIAPFELDSSVPQRELLIPHFAGTIVANHDETTMKQDRATLSSTTICRDPRLALWMTSQAILAALRGHSMHDRANGLPRIPIPRTPVNKGKKGRRRRPVPSPSLEWSQAGCYGMSRRKPSLGSA